MAAAATNKESPFANLFFFQVRLPPPPQRREGPRPGARRIHPFARSSAASAQSGPLPSSTPGATAAAQRGGSVDQLTAQNLNAGNSKKLYKWLTGLTYYQKEPGKSFGFFLEPPVHW